MGGWLIRSELRRHTTRYDIGERTHKRKAHTRKGVSLFLVGVRSNACQSSGMAQLCKACVHPRRYEIDQALISGVENQTQIAERYGISQQNAQRHKAKHIAKALVQTHDKAVALLTDPDSVQNTLAVQMLAKRAHAEKLGALAEQEKDWKTALLALREWRQLVESQERIALERRIDYRDVARSDSWKRLQSLLVRWLSPVPGAVDALRAALDEYLDGNT